MAIKEQGPPDIALEYYAPGPDGRIVEIGPDNEFREDYNHWATQIGWVKGIINKSKPARALANFFFPEDRNQEKDWPHRLGILFLKTQHLSKSSDFFWNLPGQPGPEGPGEAPTVLRRISQGKNQEVGLPYIPIISIGLEDIGPLFAEESAEELEAQKYLIREIDPRVKFLDSSIWHRYVAIKECLPAQGPFEDRFIECLLDILDYFQAGLFETVAAKASLEFQLRMLRESFIAKLGENGHYKVVTPFKFHSETRMKQKAEQRWLFFEKEWLYPLKT